MAGSVWDTDPRSTLWNDLEGEKPWTKNCLPASASAPSRCCPSRRAPSYRKMALEEEFDISVPEEELEGVETVQQAYDLVTAKL